MSFKCGCHSSAVHRPVLQLSGIEYMAQGKKAPVDPPMPKITVLNPLGTPPPIKLKNMAPRLDTLDGKTIYLVDDGYHRRR